ncbi:MAG: hypothetical protein J6X54_06980 [Treponema sp.]|nr:hypothetical protein [Treponema sp.]
MKKALSVLFSFLLIAGSVFAQSHITSQGHNSSVTALAYANLSKEPGAFYTAGEDGCIIKWTEEGKGEHYQVSEVAIRLMAVSPDGNSVAIYETNGSSINRVSVWDWKTLKRKYTKEFPDTINSLKYSAKGNYLIVGTSAMSGVQFLKAGSGALENGKLKQAANIVSYIYTSDSEKTAVFYSASGSFTYYNLQNGTLKQKYNIDSGLSQAVLFNDAKILAGIHGSEIYLVNAIKGKTIGTYPASAPIIVSSEKENKLYYLVRESNTYNLYTLNPSETLDTAKKIKECDFTIPSSYGMIVTGFKKDNELYLGTRSGQVITYTIGAGEKAKTYSQNDYKVVLDAKKVPGENAFYILTENALYKTSFENQEAEKIISTSGQRDFYIHEDKIILYSNNSMSGVSIVDLKTKKAELLFNPKFQLKRLKYYNDGNKKYLVEVENNGSIYLYDLAAKNLKQIYTGNGIQDAIMGNDGFIYVSKSSAIFPNTPLLKVNIKTYETVPVQIKGNIAFSLEKSTDGNTIYGIILHDDPNDKNTYVFAYNTEKNKYQEVLKFNSEDSDAFMLFDDTTLFTNIGRNFIYSYNTKGNKKMNFNRSASIPLKVSQNGDYVVIINTNGSISWAKSNSNAIIADWYLRSNDEWEILSKKK